MHKFLQNSVTKLKYFNFQNLVADNRFKNGANYCTIQAVSYSNSKTKIKKGSDSDITNIVVVFIFYIYLGHSNAVINFNDVITTRRAQAQRSILVQVSSEKSFSELQKYCSQYGNIIGAHHYKLQMEEFILVEYSNELEAKQALDDSTFSDTSGMCVRSQFLWFRAVKNATNVNYSEDSGKLTVTDGFRQIDYNEINEVMFGVETIADQMLILHKSTALNDLGIRLRFLAARQIEESISAMFPKAQACIFGSSVNGYGKLGCDLDLILHLNSIDPEVIVI